MTWSWNISGESLASIGRTSTELEYTSPWQFWLDPFSGQMMVMRSNPQTGFTNLAVVGNLFDHTEAQWQYIVGTENVQVLLALRDALSTHTYDNLLGIYIDGGGLRAFAERGGADPDPVLSEMITADMDDVYGISQVNFSEDQIIYGDHDSLAMNGVTVLIPDDVLSGAKGNDVLIGLLGNDKLSGVNANDQLYGGYGSDTLMGGSGADWLYGDESDDDLLGDRGRDNLSGGEGDDTLIGGLGKDTLTGGDGSDVFLFESGDSPKGAARDIIMDLQQGLDLIDLSAIDADTTTAGDQGFTLVDHFTHNPGELIFFRGLLSGDVDGDGRADIQIGLLGIASVSTADLVL